MLVNSIVGTGLLALASTAAGERIPFDHIAWGEAGPPTTLALAQRQASSTSAAATTTKVADSACSNGKMNPTNTTFHC
jgi:hypothetical protein